MIDDSAPTAKPPRASKTPASGNADSQPPRWRTWLRRGALGAVALALVAVPWWGPRLLSTLDFFHVRRVEFVGVRYGNPAELVRLLALDTLASVWMPLDPLADRVETHPMIVSARVTRRLPATLLVTVEERLPIALVPTPQGLAPVDADGAPLPIDPSAAPVDVPVLAEADSALLRLLGQIQAGAPALWSRLAAARREGPLDLRLSLGELDLRARHDVTVARLADILPVEADLARRRLRAVELDLRFRDQVIARLP